MNRSFVSALLSLVCVSSFTVLAQAPGAGEVKVTLSPAANPTASGVLLTGTVQPVIQNGTMPPPHPSGTVTFFDGTAALDPGGAPLTAGAASNAATFAQVFGAPDPAVVNFPAPPANEISGDFNGDGAPDLVLYNTDVVTTYNQNNTATVTQTMQVEVFASIPDGKFVVLPVQTFTLPQGTGLPPSACAPAVLDVDGDGHLDLLEGNVVLHGKGDGTFASPSVLPILASYGALVGYPFVQSYGVDVNGDGKLDIVAVDPLPPGGPTEPATVQFSFTVFRNNGGGTFTSLGSFPLAAPFQPAQAVCCDHFNVFGLSFADLNGDGKLDILSQSNAVAYTNAASPNHLSVILNNGDGTFGPVKAVDTSSIPSLGYDATAFADLNGDGKLDLVLGYSLESGGNYVATAVGNGDGTFGATQELLLGAQRAQGVAPFVQLLDFNLDGKIDAAFGSGELALGNGDGTFLLSTPLFPQPNPVAIDRPISYPLIQAILFPNSLPSLIYLNLTNSGNAVFTPADSSSASMNAQLTAGSHSLTAHYSGDAHYAAAVSPAATIDVAPAVTTTTVTSSANPSYAGQSVTFTGALSNRAATGTVTFLDAYPGSDPLQPILNPSPTTLGTVTVTNGVATLTASQLPSGVHTITATYSGDANNLSSTAQLTENVNLPFGVSNSGSVISLTVAPGKSVSAQLSIGALGGFSGPVTFGCRDLLATCSFNPATVNIAGTGATTVTLTVTATRAPTTAQVSPSFSETVLACGIPLFALFGIASAGRPRALFAVIAIALCGISCLGCGGGGGGGQQASSAAASVPAGTYPFYVTATWGQNELAINAVLTVQ